MKKLVLGVFIALAMFSIAGAATVEVGNNSEVRISNDVEWRKTSVTVSDSVLAYGDLWKRAYVSPGSIIPVKTHTVFTRDGLFHFKATVIIDIGIIHKADEIRLVYGSIAKQKQTFSSFLILWVLSAIAMSSFVLSSKKAPTAIIVAPIAIIVAFLTVVSITMTNDTTIIGDTAFITIMVGTFGALITAILIFVLNLAGEKKSSSSRFFVGIYYVCMAMALLSFFLS